MKLSRSSLPRMFRTNGFLVLFSGISMKTLKISMKSSFLLVRYQLWIHNAREQHTSVFPKQCLRLGVLTLLESWQPTCQDLLPAYMLYGFPVASYLPRLA